METKRDILINDISDWNGELRKHFLCTFDQLPSFFEKNYSIRFVIKEEEGLGDIYAAFIVVADVHYWLMAPVVDMDYFDQLSEGAKRDINVSVYIKSDEKDSSLALKYLLQALSIPKERLLEINDHLGPALWTLSRLDDNGNHLEMRRFLSKESALSVKRYYEKKGHKQSYFVTKGHVD